MTVLVPFQHLFKDSTRTGENQLVGLDSISILTDQGHISKVIILPENSERVGDVFLEITPLQTELSGHCKRAANFLGNAKWSKKEVRRGENEKWDQSIFFAPTSRLTQIFQEVLANQSTALFTHIQTFGVDLAQTKNNAI